MQRNIIVTLSDYLEMHIWPRCSSSRITIVSYVAGVHLSPQQRITPDLAQTVRSIFAQSSTMIISKPLSDCKRVTVTIFQSN